MSQELKKYSYQVMTMLVYGMGEKLFAFWSIGNLGTWENNTHLQSFYQFTAQWCVLKLVYLCRHVHRDVKFLFRSPSQTKMVRAIPQTDWSHNIISYSEV